MKLKQWWIGLMVGVSLAVVCGVSVADEAAVAEGPESGWDSFWAKFHNPTPWLQMGLDHRFRTIYAENIDTLNDDNAQSIYNFQRYRTRWWAKWILGEDIDFNTRLTWEFRTWADPPRRPQATDFDEVLFDRFNITLRNMFGMPLTGVIGRQDVILGVGWLMLDGTPLDGSRTIFTDSARFTYDWAAKKTKLDMIYVDNGAKTDRWLKPLGDEHRALTEQDEHGAVLYLTNTSIENVQLEGFFMYKNDNPIDSAVTNMPAQWTRKAEIYTFGGAIAGTPAERWKYRAEAAIQTGEKSDITSGLSAGTMRDLEAYGALTNLEYLFNDARSNSLHVGYEYASGDDPATADNEQFDLLWAEWPRWSELYIYTYTNETMIAESTNLHRLNVGHKFKPCKAWEISTDYHALWADEMGQPWNPGGLTLGSSRFRGHLITCWAKYKYGTHIAGHLLGEYLIPGDYYAAVNNDEAFWLRFNLEYTF
ncbi:MAG: alginate export family protein [Sedimentisphaerales bacterium]|nr:alginate export family protein [Sedimentisphaerales bacterium]